MWKAVIIKGVLVFFWHFATSASVAAIPASVVLTMLAMNKKKCPQLLRPIVCLKDLCTRALRPLPIPCQANRLQGIWKIYVLFYLTL